MLGEHCWDGGPVVALLYCPKIFGLCKNKAMSPTLFTQCEEPRACIKKQNLQKKKRFSPQHSPCSPVGMSETKLRSISVLEGGFTLTSLKVTAVPRPFQPVNPEAALGSQFGVFRVKRCLSPFLT